MTKYIFVTGGVVSSVGKGITVASLGRLLKSRGFSVSVIKLDPYLNVDPGTMSPYQHGEVFVTTDGCETDLDLGHYERFIDVNLTSLSNLTAGQVYSTVLSKERRGDFLGGTIQVVPHVTNEIKERILRASRETKPDVLIAEVGGTVGDIEGLPFLEAIRQMRKEVGRENVLYIHLTYLPMITATKELKTKPTQHSVKELRSIGIQPDIIVCRSEYPVSEDIKHKISLFCDVDPNEVIPLLTVESTYEVPLILENAGMGDAVVKALGLPERAADLVDWRAMIAKLKQPKEPIKIAIVGKYVELEDSYLSVKEALKHASLMLGMDLNLSWVQSELLEHGDRRDLLSDVKGIVVPGGFGYRGVEGMIKAAAYSRENKVPYLGLCLGMQLMVVDFARQLFNSSEPNSTEFNKDTKYPVIDLMAEQRTIKDMGGTMRLGVYPCKLMPESKAALAYGTDIVHERHRHRFEFNNTYREQFEEAGLMASGTSPDGKLVEIVELVGHPFMVGTQFHAEFTSRPNRPQPLFREFIRAAIPTIRAGEQPPLPLGTDTGKTQTSVKADAVGNTRN